MPKLALRSPTILHSLLAISAACLCHDLIVNEPVPDANAINRILLAGYRHYNLAIQQIRESVPSLKILDSEILLASAVLLVPFATASQQINHWISRNKMARESYKLLSTTPSDVFIIMRAIRKMLENQHSGMSSALPENTNPIHSAISRTSPHTTLTPSRTHVMLPVLVTTLHHAFAKLQQRLDTALLNHSEEHGEELLACSTSFDILKYISSKALSSENTTCDSSPTGRLEDSFTPKAVPLPDVPLWLRSFARKATNPRPTEPLTSLLLSFLAQVPQTYLDMIVPLLNQRLESPANDNTTQTTKIQALALDVYAHWSVLMFLAEEDSWWIGDLPIVTLTGMINRFGDDFVERLWPGTCPKEPWWPGSMLGILREIKRHR